jgi:hypothetical protein
MPYVANSEIHGLGVFADKDYTQGDTIELCPYLITDYTDVGDECILHDYMFHTPYIGEEEYYIPLGLAMVYNHSTSPNAEWEIEEDDDRFIKFFALKEIKQGEEILHDYGLDYWESRDATITDRF